jgi:hypothetical protein
MNPRTRSASPPLYKKLHENVESFYNIGRVELSPDGRHRDVDQGAIQQCHPRTKDSRGNQPPRTRRRQRQLAWLDIFTARGLVHA